MGETIKPGEFWGSKFPLLFLRRGGRDC